MKNNESTENYLKTILNLHERNGYVRSIDIAHELNFSKPSVSVAMKSFREKNYISIDNQGNISLTPIGLDIAEKVCEKHLIIASALVGLGVDEKTAYEDSCKIEHDISEISFQKIKEHLKLHSKGASRSGDIDVVLL